MSGGTQGSGVKRWGGPVAAPALSPDRIFADADKVLWLEYDAPHVTTHFTSRYLLDEVRNKFAGSTGALNLPASDGTRMTWHASGGPGDRPYVDGSLADRVGNTATTWVAADTSWRIYHVGRVDNWAGSQVVVEMGTLRLRRNAASQFWAIQHVAAGVAAVSTVGGTSAWAAIRAHYIDDTQIGIGVNNETVVTAAITAGSYALSPLCLSNTTDSLAGAADAQAMTIIVRGEPDADEDALMAAYINRRFGATDLPALTWGGTVYASASSLPQTGTQGGQIKRWAGPGSVPNNQRYAIPFPADGLPPLGIVDDGTGELIVDDTDDDFIVEGLSA